MRRTAPGPFEPIDVGPDLVQAPAFHAEMRVTPRGSYVEARILLDGTRIAAIGVGRTLGEALMVAGALMTGTPIVPLHKRFWRRLR